MGSVTDARSTSVGTRVELTAGAAWRNPSYEAKKNVRLRRIGPPSVAPNWLRLREAFAPPSLFVKKSAAFSLVFRKYSNAAP